MKKIILALILILTLTLSACEETPEQPEIDCNIFKTHVDCKEDEEDPVDIPVTGEFTGQYDNLGATSDLTYDGRDITNEDCDHLENIGQWQPVWCDEFEYNGLPNEDLWGYDFGGSGWGNNELQYYTKADKENAFVGNGLLTIKGIKETHLTNGYTSARLITKNTGDWLYGKIQVRAKVPAGRGTWPAIWMLPTNWSYGGWPTSGEIDIMEYVGYQENVIHGTIHTDLYNHSLNTQVGKSKTLNTAEEEFHVYEMEWEPGVIELFIDGISYAKFEYDAAKSINEESFKAWPFDQQFHLLLNLAIGGNWGGAQGVDETIWPAEFLIDYVRVYQKDYEGMDNEAPSAATNLLATFTTPTSLFIQWDKATDDVLVKEYEVYVDDVLQATTTVNGHLLTNLDADTAYSIKIIAVDFKDQKSAALTETISSGAPQAVTSRIEAENYVGMSGIQLESTQDTGGGQNIGYIDDGDYLEYVLKVEETGTYTVDVRYASPSNGLGVKVLQDNNLLVNVNGGATGGWQMWATATSGTFTLTEGTYTFRVEATNSGFNLNYFIFKKVD